MSQHNCSHHESPPISLGHSHLRHSTTCSAPRPAYLLFHRGSRNCHLPAHKALLLDPDPPNPDPYTLGPTCPGVPSSSCCTDSPASAAAGPAALRGDAPAGLAPQDRGLLAWEDAAAPGECSAAPACPHRHCRLRSGDSSQHDPLESATLLLALGTAWLAVQAHTGTVRWDLDAEKWRKEEEDGRPDEHQPGVHAGMHALAARIRGPKHPLTQGNSWVLQQPLLASVTRGTWPCCDMWAQHLEGVSQGSWG